MAHPFYLPEQAKVVSGLKPATDAAGRTGAYVTLKGAHKLYIVCHVDQGNAATIQFNVLQATDVSGTSSKAITNAVRVWSNLDCAAGDTLVARTAAVNYTTDAGLKIKQVVFEVDPASLDMANGFDCVAIQTGASNVANLTAATYFLTGLRYAQATPPSAVID